MKLTDMTGMDERQIAWALIREEQLDRELAGAARADELADVRRELVLENPYD